MLHLIAKQYKFSEEIELLISDYLIGSDEYYKNLQLKINKNILNIARLIIHNEDKHKYDNLKKYINKIKFYILDYKIIECKISVTNRHVGIYIAIDFTETKNNDNINKIRDNIKSIINNKIKKRGSLAMHGHKINNNIYKVLFISDS